MTRVAAIDCGTNTIRLLVAEAARSHDGEVSLDALERRNHIVRLGQDVDRTGMLDPSALERTLEAVSHFARRCEALEVRHLRFVATSATRDASNREVFTQGVRRLLGVEPEVVSGQEEARLSFCGAMLGASDTPEPRLVVDLGGGSTELVLGGSEPTAAISLDIGSVRLTERYLADGLSATAEESARAEVRSLLDHGGRVVDYSAVRTLVGLAGTITTVTSHHTPSTDDYVRFSNQSLCFQRKIFGVSWSYSNN